MEKRKHPILDFIQSGAALFALITIVSFSVYVTVTLNPRPFVDSGVAGVSTEFALEWENLYSHPNNKLTVDLDENGESLIYNFEISSLKSGLTENDWVKLKNIGDKPVNAVFKIKVNGYVQDVLKISIGDDSRIHTLFSADRSDTPVEIMLQGGKEIALKIGMEATESINFPFELEVEIRNL